MIIECKLDSMLRYYKRNPKYNNEEYQKLAIDVWGDDSRKMHDKVYSDGFVINEKLENEMIITYTTVAGIIWLRKGGYTVDLFYRTFSTILKIIASFILVGATVISAFLLYRQNKLIEGQNHSTETNVQILSQKVTVLEKSLQDIRKESH